MQEGGDHEGWEVPALCKGQTYVQDGGAHEGGMVTVLRG